MAIKPRQPGGWLGLASLCAALIAVAGLLGLSLASPADGADQPRLGDAVKRDPLAGELEQRLADDVRPVLQKYCYECHANGKKKGGVQLDGPGDIKSIMAMADDWQTVIDVINARLMPPEKKPQPTEHEILTIQQWVDEAVDYYPANAEPDPGWYTIHRLNRSEYRNTLRDLIGIDPDEHDLAEHLPADDTGYGFDNIADVLSMSPLQLEKYLDAAERAIELSLGSDSDAEPVRLRDIQGKAEKPNDARVAEGGAFGLYTNGRAWADHAFPFDGTYKIDITVYGTKVEDKGPDVTVRFGDKVLEELDLKASSSEPATLSYELKVKAGKHRISLEYTNNQVTDREDRNLFVRSIEVTGPRPDELPNRTAYREVFFVQPTADEKGRPLPGVERGTRRITEVQAAKQVIERFASRAFRRPIDAGEIAALLRLFSGAREQGDSYESAVRLTLTATLVSPNFLYRSIANPRANDPEFVYELNDYELASRLSYFLWSSMPDDRLLDLAKRKQLRKPEVLRGQVKRMLMDPKSDALVENFAGQWLLLRKLDGLEMDPQRFPEFDDDLREAMRAEAELFFADVLRKDQSVLSFIDSDRTFLNEKLAEHYGVRGVRGELMRPVDLPGDSSRGGVLTMAATLTVTSEATRTSPVKRGDYVLSQILGTPPPPPPPDVPPLEQATEELGEEATLREQLAAHVANPNCAVCHKRLDPIGLAMENFTATGAWRDAEKGKPIDASGELPGGIRFNGPVELKKIMLDQSDLFVQNLSKKMLTYATGRGTEPFDRPTIKKIAQSVEDNNNRMQALIEAVVLSDAFLKARGRETQP